MDTWMAWANEDPSKLSRKRTCIGAPGRIIRPSWWPSSKFLFFKLNFADLHGPRSPCRASVFEIVDLVPLASK